MIISPPAQIVDEQGNQTNRMRAWTEEVSALDILIGTGTPEGAIEARQGRLYMDDSGAAGSILYVKRDPDIAGDKTKGWILV